MESFFHYLQYEKRYSPRTLESYRTDLEQCCAYLKHTYDKSDPAEADYQMLRSWFLTLPTQGLEPKSIARKQASLRSYYKFLIRSGKMATNPMARIRSPKLKKRLPVFVEEERMEHLLDKLVFPDDYEGLRDKTIIELLYGTGMRRAELLGLKDGDIDLSRGTLKVLGKGNKERYVPVNNTLKTTIEGYAHEKRQQGIENPSHYFVVHKDGRPLEPKQLYSIVKKYLAMVTTQDKKSPHVLRHTFATHMLNRGAEINAVKEMLGHSSLAATQVYTHNSLDKLKKVHESAHPNKDRPL